MPVTSESPTLPKGLCAHGGHTFSTQAVGSSSLAFVSCLPIASVLARSESLGPSQFFLVHACSPGHFIPQLFLLNFLISLLFVYLRQPQSYTIAFFFSPQQMPLHWVSPKSGQIKTALRVRSSREPTGQLMTVLYKWGFAGAPVCSSRGCQTPDSTVIVGHGYPRLLGEVGMGIGQVQMLQSSLVY